MKFSRYIFLVILFATACNMEEVNNEVPKEVAVEEDIDVLEFDSIAAASIAYRQYRDLDGDGIDDEIYFEFTGGAHCCYYMSLELSSKDSLLSYPFEMDGGYRLGVEDNSPGQFQIKDFDNDGLPEIYMEIHAYNGEASPLEIEWTRDYGIITSHIIFDYIDGVMEVRDYISN
jgi:hypothetical protein